MPDKARELLEEFRAVTGKVGLLDTILPPMLFLLLNGLAGFNAAMIGALGLSFVIAVLRLRRSRDWEASVSPSRLRFCSDVRRDSSSQASSTAA
jgi:hypothetical protein